ncbi:MAG: serine/threonine-protein kinase [Phycisphaeraceae bacterium]
MAEFHEIAGYEVLATLGHGARSSIYSVRDKQGDPFALKRVVKRSPSDQRFIDQAKLEHEISSKFDHPALRRSYRLIRQRQFIRVSEVLVLMELIDGETLEQYQPAAGFAELLDVCRQVGEGLAAMHELGYVHADIKPNNIMIGRTGQAKIIDFGQSCEVGTIKQRIQGTPDYIAPEQVRRQRITPQTDVFNLGATLYWLLTRRHVPTLIPKGQAGITLRTEERCPPPTEFNEEVPPALSTLVMDCIATEPVQRPASMRAVLDRLAIAAAQVIRRRGDGASDLPRRRSAS